MIKRFCVIEILSLLFFILGCSSEKVKSNFQFYYYPEKNVYYDPVKKIFFYSLDGAKTWGRFNSANSNEPATLGKKVLIYTGDTEVFKENDKHRKVYAGRLYAINTLDTGAAVTTHEVMERPIVVTKKKQEVKKQVAEKHKSGIGKFIDKIFGKKKQ